MRRKPAGFDLQGVARIQVGYVTLRWVPGTSFHGGFVKALGRQKLSVDTFVTALSKATRIAALPIQSFGTRQWLEEN